MATAKKDLTTRAAVERWLKRAEERGLAPTTAKTYKIRIRHFAEDFPTVPALIDPIERWLKARKEGPGKRGALFHCLQAFYSYLETNEDFPSPLPRGKVGRPSKRKLVQRTHESEPVEVAVEPTVKLVQGGGVSLSSFMSMSTEKALDALLVSKRRIERSPRTIERYRLTLTRFCKAFPTFPTDTTDLEKYLVELKVSVATRNDHLRDIKVLYRFTLGRLHLPKDSIELPLIATERKIRRHLGAQELAQVFQGIRSFEDRCMLCALLDTGCRGGELVSMDRERIYPDHAIVSGKTGERVVPLSRQTYDLLCQLRQSGAVFQVNGKRMKRFSLYTRIRAILERAGFDGEKLGPHLLRHSSAVADIMAGGDLATLQAKLGHTTSIMTAKYARLAPREMLRKHQQMNVLGKLLEKVDHNFAVCTHCGQSTMYAEGDWGKVQCRVCHAVGAWKLPANGDAALATAAPENQGGF